MAEINSETEMTLRCVICIENIQEGDYNRHLATCFLLQRSGFKCAICREEIQDNKHVVECGLWEVTLTRSPKPFYCNSRHCIKYIRPLHDDNICL